MRVVLQKVTYARVEIDNKTVAEIANGFLLLVAITHTDTEVTVQKMVEKVLKLRLFADAHSDTFMERSIVDEGGAILAVSQFTLYGDCTKGTRPSFTDAAKPEQAKPLYALFVQMLIATGIAVQTGEFGEHMEVTLTNDGPITLILDT